MTRLIWLGLLGSVLQLSSVAGAGAGPRSRGTVVWRKTKRGKVAALRFWAQGERQYVTLGLQRDGWTQRRADDELANVLVDVRRGTWEPPGRKPEPPRREMPTFHVFASEWFAAQLVEGGRNGTGLTASGEADLRWRLSNHLLPVFAERRLDQIAIEDVDRFRRGKVASGLSAASVNKLLMTLASVLETAVEYGLLERNVAKGRRRRVKQPAPQRTWLDRADHIEALLDAAAVLDASARVVPGQRRALLATLTLAGLRIGELLDLRWRDVDLARGVIHVRQAKTAAGVRRVDILPALRDELAAYRAGMGDTSRDGLMFCTAMGRRHGASNIRRRVLAPAVVLANSRLKDAGLEELPPLTPHSLRRTFASLLVAIGEDPAYVMAQMGHTTPNLTLSLYAKVMQRRDGERERLRVLAHGPVTTEQGPRSPTLGPHRVSKHERMASSQVANGRAVLTSSWVADADTKQERRP